MSVCASRKTCNNTRMKNTNKTTSENPPEIALTISARTIVKVLLVVVGSIMLLSALRQVAGALVLLGISAFLAIALNAPVSWIGRHLPGKRKGSRALATTISFIFVLLLLAGFLAAVLPPIISQTRSFVSNAPEFVQDLRNENSELGRFVARYNLQGQLDNVSGELSSRLQNIGKSAFSTISSVGSSIFTTLTVLVLTFMMLIEGPKWVKFSVELMPRHKHDRARHLLKEMSKVVKGYVNGQVLLAAIAALVLLPGFLVFDISYPIALLGIVFICGLIPMVGHTIGAIIVSLVALFTSPFAAIGILAYYFLYQQIENYLIQPRVQANSTNMSPLLVFSSVVVGVSFSGLLGGLVAIPVAGCIRVLLLDYLASRKNMTHAEAADHSDI